MAASLKKLYQDWLAQVQKDNKGTIVAEQFISAMQIQGIIRQNDVYAVTKKTSNEEQNRELFLTILPNYGDFALKKFVKMLQTDGKTSQAEILTELDNVRKANLKSGEVVPQSNEPEPIVETKVPEKVNPIEEANKTFHQPSGVLSGLKVDLVEKPSAEKTAWESKKEQVYANFKSNLGYKGLALIISNEKFMVPWLKDRVGSEIDVQNMSTLLTALGYKVDVHRNLVAQAMTYLMQYFALDQRHSEFDSAVVVLLTHGLPNGNLYGTDGETLFVEDLVGFLNARYSKNLAGKPKIFFVEACRSFASIDSNRKVMEDFETNNSYSNIPNKSDIVIGYPRTPAYLSPRDVENGSWFIQLVCEEFSKKAKSSSILDLFEEVRKRIEQERTADGPLLSAAVCDCLKKQFYFFPGV